MDSAEESSNENIVEFEDVQFSDAEDEPSHINEDCKPLINIDYNSRIASSATNFDTSSDNCDTQLFDNSGYSFVKRVNNESGGTSSEEFDLSGEDELYSAVNVIKKIDFDCIASASGKHHLESSSSFDLSSTSYKEECLTDAEYISDEEINFEMNKIVNGCLMKDRKQRRLSFGLTVADLASTVKDVFSSKQTSLAALNVNNPFASSIEIKNKSLPMSSQEKGSPLMTCLEFLTSDPTEDELTDIEDFSPDLCENHPSSTPYDLEEVFRYRGKGGLQMPKNKKDSWTVEMLSDDENSSSGNKQISDRSTSMNIRNKKRNSNTSDCNKESLTDEELIDIGGSEWTETDNSGSVRQITQIKTETSIKLEGDGDGSAFDSDDLISRATTTTTTRIVTTVTTDHQDDDEQQEADGDDLRHSVEVILNQFMSDGDSSKPDGDQSGQEE